MKLKPSYFFTALVIGLAVYTYIFEYQASLQEEQKVEEAKQILSLASGDKEKVQKLQLMRGGQELILSKSSEGWKIEKPIMAWADPNAMADWLEALFQEKSIETIKFEQAPSWETYGLMQPKATLTVTAQGISQTLEISEKRNFEGNSFLRKDGSQEVTVASANWSGLTDKTLRDLRDKRLLRAGTIGIEQVEIKGLSEINLQVREGLWVLKDEPKLALSQNAVRELVNTLNDARAIDFITEDLPTEKELMTYGFKTSPLRVRFLYQDKKEWWAELAMDKANSWYARSSDEPKILKMPMAQIERLIRANRDSIRDKEAPFIFNTPEVVKIVVTGEGAMELKKGKDLWTWDRKEDLDQNQVEQLIKAIRNLRIGHFQDGKKDFSTKGQMSRSLSLLDQGGQVILSLDFAAVYKDVKSGVPYMLMKSSKYQDIFGIEETAYMSVPFARLHKLEEKAKEN